MTYLIAIIKALGATVALIIYTLWVFQLGEKYGREKQDKINRRMLTSVIDQFSTALLQKDKEGKS